MAPCLLELGNLAVLVRILEAGFPEASIPFSGSAAVAHTGVATGLSFGTFLGLGGGLGSSTGEGGSFCFSTSDSEAW